GLAALDDPRDGVEDLAQRVDPPLELGAPADLADEDADQVGVAAPGAEHDRRHLPELLPRRLSRLLDRADRAEQLVPGLAEDDLEELVLRGEVVVEQPVRDTGLLGDVADPARVEALAREDADRRVANQP